jgi:hypothetical protein
MVDPKGAALWFATDEAAQEAIKTLTDHGAQSRMIFVREDERRGAKAEDIPVELKAAEYVGLRLEPGPETSWWT